MTKNWIARWISTGLVIWAALVSDWTKATPPADFTDAPIYEIGEIPFQTAWQGQEIKFRVRASALGSSTLVSAGYINPPSGLIYSEAGNFYYRPASGDTAEFTVTFSATSGSRHLEQIVPIQPIPLLPAETDLVGVGQTGTIDPSSRDYIVISDTKALTTAPFNYVDQHVRSVSVSGKEVVIRQGHANHLFETFQNSPDIGQFVINAEKVVVASAFHLPSTSLIIRSRELEFQDVGGQNASISTEPPQNPKSAAKSYSELVNEGLAPISGDNGSTGLPGGDIKLFVESLKLGAPDLSPVPRFILNGDAGQNSGAGLDGTSASLNIPRIKPAQLGPLDDGYKEQTTALVIETIIPPIPGTSSGQQTRLDVYLGPFVLFKSLSSVPGSAYVDAQDFLESRAGNTWRLAGQKPQDAIPDGLPGAGGASGHLLTSLDPSTLVAWSQMNGGLGGSGQGRKGGAPRDPAVARAYYRFANGTYKLIASDTQAGGADAPAPAPGAIGAAGSVAKADATWGWFTAAALRQVVNHARDSFLKGDTAYAGRVVSDYIAQLEQFRASSAWTDVTDNEKRDFQLIDEEMRLVNFQIGNNLDYFGNPPGWVPLLSLEASKLVFEQEVNRAMGILYLEYWLTNAAYTLQQKIGALTDARQKLAAHADQLSGDYNDANNLLPTLDERAQRIQAEVTARQSDLMALEAKLFQQAEANVKGPLWKRVARGLWAICKFVPVPQVQAIGAGLDIVGSLNPDAPWDSISKVVDVVGRFEGGEFKTNAASLNADYKKIKFPDLPKSADPGVIGKYLDDLQKQSKVVVADVQKIQAAYRDSQKPSSQIDAELSKLEVESSEFKTIKGQISDLMAEKQDFAQQMAQAINTLTTASAQISENLLAMDALNESYALAVGALDDRATVYLREIGRRARERLLLYHYYVKKAYEYRLLKPYLGDLDLQSMFDRIAQIAANSSGTYTQLTSDQFQQLRGIYDDALGEIVRAVVDEYTRNAPPTSGQRQIALGAPELDQLNAGLPVSLNLATRVTPAGIGVFPASEENVRISDVLVYQLQAEPLVNADVSETLDLNITHTGVSTLKSSTGGVPHSYRFVHYTHGTEIPVQWGARYRPSDEQVSQLVRSPSTDSLLGSILSGAGTDPSKMDYFSYLGGLAELKVDRLLSTRDQRNVRLTNVVLEIHYEFVRRGANLRSLSISTADGLVPYIQLSTPDLSGRKDAMGNFQRTYSSGKVVTISVPDRIGNLRLRGFFERSTALAGGQAVHALAGTVRGPRVTALNAEGSKMQSVNVTVASDRQIELHYEPVPVLELDIENDVANFLLRLDGEHYTSFLIEQAGQVNGPWFPLQSGTLMEPLDLSIPRSNPLQKAFYRARKQ